MTPEGPTCGDCPKGREKDAEKSSAILRRTPSRLKSGLATSIFVPSGPTALRPVQFGNLLRRRRPQSL